MKLIPEQIKYLRQRKKELELKRKEYKRYLETRDRTGYEKIGMPQFGDFASDMEYVSYFEELKKIEDELARSTFHTERNFDFIDVGTLFQIRFSDEDLTEELMLVEKGITHDSVRLVSLDSDLGKAVKGHKENDSLTYVVQATGRKIPVTIEKIITMKDKYERFIRERKLTDRMSDVVKKDLRTLKQNDPEEYENRHAITPSQLELAKEELSRISVSSKDQSDISKRGYLQKLIRAAQVVTPPEDGSIGVGPHVEVLLTDENNNVQELSFEFINAAVSTELASDYVERISPLGNTIFGLKENDTFQVIRKNKPRLKGIIKSVDNQNEIRRVK